MFGMPELKMEGIQVKDMDHLNTIIKDKKPKIILVYAPWCGHCQALKPMWNSFVKDGNEKSCYAVSDSVMGENSNIGNEEIKGFPTILINKRDGTITQYQEKDNQSVTQKGLQDALNEETDSMFGGKRKSKHSRMTKKRKSNKLKLKNRKSGKKALKSKRKTKKH